MVLDRVYQEREVADKVASRLNMHGDKYEVEKCAVGYRVISRKEPPAAEQSKPSSDTAFSDSAANALANTASGTKELGPQVQSVTYSLGDKVAEGLIAEFFHGVHYTKVVNNWPKTGGIQTKAIATATAEFDWPSHAHLKCRCLPWGHAYMFSLHVDDPVTENVPPLVGTVMAGLVKNKGIYAQAEVVASALSAMLQAYTRILAGKPPFPESVAADCVYIVVKLVSESEHYYTVRFPFEKKTHYLFKKRVLQVAHAPTKLALNMASVVSFITMKKSVAKNIEWMKWKF